MTSLPNVPTRRGRPTKPYRTSWGEINLNDLGDNYYNKSASKQNTRGHVRSAIKRLAHITQAQTLAELTTPLLIKFRDEIINQIEPTGATALFGKVKSALAFARKEGWDGGHTA